MASAILNPINSTLIAVALVPIGQSFGAGPGQTAWLISALYLATAVGQPVVGQFVDRFGARRVLLPERRSCWRPESQVCSRSPSAG